MLTYSAFVRHYCDNLRHMPRAAAEAIRRAALARLTERWRAGRGDKPLCFADLCERIEAAIAPHAEG